MIQTYDEFNVVYVGKKISKKTPTERGQVRISEHTAEVNNYYTNSTGMLYELAIEEKQEAKPKGRPPKK